MYHARLIGSKWRWCFAQFQVSAGQDLSPFAEYLRSFSNLCNPLLFLSTQRNIPSAAPLSASPAAAADGAAGLCFASAFIHSHVHCPPSKKPLC